MTTKSRTQAIAYTVVSGVLLMILSTAGNTLADHGYRTVFLGACVETAVVVLVTVLAWLSGGPSVNRPPARINFTWIVIFEGVLAGLGNSYILNNHHAPEWMVTWTTLVVGLHFVLMGWSERRRVYYPISALLITACAAGAGIGISGRLYLMAAVVLGALFTTLSASVVGSYLRTTAPRHRNRARTVDLHRDETSPRM